MGTGKERESTAASFWPTNALFCDSDQGYLTISVTLDFSLDNNNKFLFFLSNVNAE